MVYAINGRPFNRRVFLFGTRFDPARASIKATVVSESSVMNHLSSSLSDLG